jgi:hypothetical protein
VVSGDTLRTMIRNLSAGELHSEHRPGSGAGISLGFGGVAAYEPSRSEIGFALGDGEDRVAVEGTIGTLRPPGRGTVRVSAQLIVRRAPAT